MNPAPRPTPLTERIHALDAMRGVAILGVLVAYTVWSLGNPPEDTWTRADRAVKRGMDLLVDGKFLSMFAFLFGLGVAQQWRRWSAAGYDPVPFHARRMGFLLGVGLLHAVLLRNGDILAPYAILGLALLLGRWRSSKVLLIAAPLLFIAPYFVEAAMAAMKLSWPDRPTAASGGYLAENLAWLRYWYETNPVLGWPQILPLMLAGVVVGRAQWIERLAAGRGPTVRILVAALALAVLTRLVLDGTRGGWMAGTPAWTRKDAVHALFQVNAWTVAGFYVAGLLLLSRQRFGTALLTPFRAVGRMAFTNYLLQATLVVPLCLASHLFDNVSPWRGVEIALAVGTAQVAFSTWWLRRHPMGPLESLWRRVTYGSGAPSA